MPRINPWRKWGKSRNFYTKKYLTLEIVFWLKINNLFNAILSWRIEGDTEIQVRIRVEEVNCSWAYSERGSEYG